MKCVMVVLHKVHPVLQERYTHYQ